MPTVKTSTPPLTGETPVASVYSMRMADSPPTLLLLSGGMDSATCLWWMRANLTGDVHAVCIDYHQRHRIELEYAALLAQQSGVTTHALLEIDLSSIGGSPLTDDRIDVPSASEDQQSVTVVPFRNLLFVAAAAARAQALEIDDIYIAPVRDDAAAYRDCRREFYDSLEQTLRLGAPADRPVTIHTPFVDMWKRDVIRVGLELGVPYEMTHTCYSGRRPACGLCDACVERIDAFRANGAADPLDYEIDIDWS